MELPTKTVVLIAGDAKYALPQANITKTAPTAERPLKSFLAKTNVDAKKSWRMVYDGKRIRDLFEAEGQTHTIYNLFCAETKQECVIKGEALGMTIPEDLTFEPVAKIEVRS